MWASSPNSKAESAYHESAQSNPHQHRYRYQPRPTGHLGPTDWRVLILSNTPQGAEDAVRALRTFKPDRITIESTGRLEFHFVKAAHQAKLPVAVCNPGDARKFAKSIGRAARTEKLDAMNIHATC